MFTNAILSLALAVTSLSALASPPAQQVVPAPARTFLLLVYPIEAGKAAPAYTSKAEGALVAEYRAWAQRLKDEGLLVDAAKLEEAGALVSLSGVARGAAPGSQPPVSGYFLVRAADEASAADLARTCPHVGYGGTVVVREIATTKR